MRAFGFWGIIGVIIAVSLMHYSTPEGSCMPTTTGAVTHAIHKCSPDVLERLQTPTETPDPNWTPPWVGKTLPPGESWGA